MRIFGTSCCLVVAIVLSGLTAHDSASRDDRMLTRLVANAAKGNNQGKIHRITKTPFKMAPETTLLCIGPGPRHESGPHSDCFCHVYVNEPAVKPMKTGQGTYPAGSLIIKQKYSDADGTKTELFTVMRKMPGGYDPDNGDWEYSVIDSTASKVLARGRTDSCIDCHTEYESTDYVTRLYLQPGR